MDDVVGDGGEVRGGVGGGGSQRNPCLINWITLLGEACATPSSSPDGDQINALYLGPFLPSFLPIRFFTSHSSEHQGSGITYYSHNNILIQVFKDFKYLPCRPLKNHRSTSEVSTSNSVKNPPMMQSSQ